MNDKDIDIIESAQAAAFSEGSWTLIGASDGVELYVTHKKTARPSSAVKGFNITVYSKLVNTNSFAMGSGDLGVSITFYYYDIEKKTMIPRVIENDSVIQSKQVIVKDQQIFTNSADIQYTGIKSFIFKRAE